MAFDSGRLPEDWEYNVIVPLNKGKEERTEYKNYRNITLLNVVGKILFFIKFIYYKKNLISPLRGRHTPKPKKERRRKEQVSEKRKKLLRSGRYVDLKQIGEKALEKKQRVYGR